MNCYQRWRHGVRNLLHGVLGTVFQDESGAIVTNPERPQIANLDSIPGPIGRRLMYRTTLTCGASIMAWAAST